MKKKKSKNTNRQKVKKKNVNNTKREKAKKTISKKDKK